MKRTLAVVTVLGMSAALSGCLFSSEDKPAAAPAQAQTAPLWKLSLESKCAEDATQCVAGYGFSVTADGKYTIGPSPTGKTASGVLSKEESAALLEKLTALTSPNADEAASEAEASSAAAESRESCQQLSNENNDHFVLTFEGKERVLAQVRETQLCYSASNSRAAEELHNLVKELANRYYPVPFPNLCSDEASALDQLYAVVQSCKADSDCIYVDQELNAVPPSSDQWISSNSCTPVRPLAVASVKALGAQHEAVVKAYASTLKACGIEAQNVTSCDGVMSSAGAPRCEQGVCRVHAAPQQ